MLKKIRYLFGDHLLVPSPCVIHVLTYFKIVKTLQQMHTREAYQCNY